MQMTKYKTAGLWLCVALILVLQEQVKRWGIDPTVGQWKGWLAKNWVRFAFREFIVYAQLLVGYALLNARFKPLSALRKMFLATTVGLDLLFLGIAALRGFYPQWEPLIKLYNQLNYSLGSGILVVLFYGLGKVNKGAQSA